MIDLDASLAHVASSAILDGCDVRRLAVTEPAPIDLAAGLAGALMQPTGSPRLAEVARGRGSAAIITADATRAVPSRELLPAVVAELNGAGIPDERIHLVIGTGAHRPLAQQELLDLLGKEWVQRLRVSNHDARAGDLVSVGCTPRGNDVLVNRLIVEAGVRVALGQVEPHEFAGYTGGRKAILPSVAGYDTIIRNHSIGMIGDPGARPGELAANPINDEMLAAARLARLDFIVNVAVDRELRPLAVAAGDVESAHQRLVRFIESYATVEVPEEPPDLVVTGPGRPLDYNLYQSIKPLVAIQPLVDARSVVVLLSACRDGAGSKEMFEPFAGAASPQEALARVSQNYTIEKDHSFFLARFLTRCPQVIAQCPGVSDAELRTLRLEPAASVDDALRRGRRQVATRRARPLVLLFPRPQRALIRVGGSRPVASAAAPTR
ncbi:MAG: nickel-dependent lactate racemase [Candidatus Methylomirabilales bacterium]